MRQLKLCHVPDWPVMSLPKSPAERRGLGLGREVTGISGYPTRLQRDGRERRAPERHDGTAIYTA